ncbi:MAG: methionine adenosyltransferase [Actinobacteria bacterium]|nr:methionine adenosyltransferase [Actinomycetota bacterium]
MSSHFVFTSESVTEGHPDKVCDQVSDAVLDAVLAQDPMSRVACETLVKTGFAVIAGELTTDAVVDFQQVVRDTITGIGYDNGAVGFDGKTCGVLVALDKQSADIAQGVDDALEARSGQQDHYDRVGAGDQGMMFGYACDENEDLMPTPIWLAHRLSERLAAVRKDGTLGYLCPDGKTQVSIRYDNGRPVALERVLISTQTAPGTSIASTLRPDLIEQVILPTIPEFLAADFEVTDDTVFINPTGSFEVGGPVADAGLTGRKIIVDTYGGWARHGGGAFSGKDCTKVDRSAAYATRHVAKSVVAAGLAHRCEVQVAYAIGKARPMSIMVEDFGTGQVDPDKLAVAVEQVFDLRPAAIIDNLDLRRPIYAPTAAYGHFGRSDLDLPWEHTEQTANKLRDAVNAN